MLTPHVFTALTVKFPPLNVELKLNVIDDDVEVPEAPEGIVQMYEVAPDTGAML